MGAHAGGDWLQFPPPCAGRCYYLRRATTIPSAARPWHWSPRPRRCDVHLSIQPMPRPHGRPSRLWVLALYHSGLRWHRSGPIVNDLSFMPYRVANAPSLVARVWSDLIRIRHLANWAPLAGPE